MKYKLLVSLVYRPLVKLGWAGGLALFGLLNPLAAEAAAPAPSDQSSPAAASNGDITLVVWQDRRNGSDYDVYGSRINSAGAVLDTILISSAPGNQTQPAVACDGTTFLVVWSDFRGGLTSDIYGARVSASGAVLDPQGIPICTAAMHQGQPTAASNGGGFLVVWQDFRSAASADIYGARLSGAGVVLDSTGLVISQGVNSELNPAVAANSTGYLVAWQDKRSGSSYDIFGARVTAGGAISDPAGLAISTAAGDQINPAVSGNGSDFLVVWQDFRSGSSFDIYGAVVTGIGVVNHSNGIVISTAGREQFNPVVASYGADYLAVWTDNRDSGNFTVHGVPISAAGVVAHANAFAVTSAAGDHYHPAVARSTLGYWVVWQDYRSRGAADIYGSRVNGTGAVTDASGVLISVLGVSAPPQTPVITWTQPADILYGTALSASQLNATANVSGTFSYNPAIGTVLRAGNGQPLVVTFAPADPINYSSASATVALNVGKALLAIRADDKTKLAGQPNPALTATYSGFVNGDTAASLSSPPSLTTTATTGSPAGSYPIVASGAAGANYAITFVNGTLTVTPTQTPVITWAQPANIIYGTALSASQLNATANVSGTFSYDPALGTVLRAGNGQTLAATFTPADPVTYSSASATVVINVGKAPLVIRADDRTKLAGQSNPALTATYTGFVNGDTAASLIPPPSLTTTATTGSPAGSYPIVASGAAGANYAINFVNGTLTVTPNGVPATSTFANTSRIRIGDSGLFHPYPSRVAVSGMNGKVSKVIARITDLNYSNPDNLSVLLVGPAGQKVVLMSGAGGREDLDHANLTLDSTASRALPDRSVIRSGVYRPTNYTPTLTFASPAPRQPYDSSLATFNNTDPNGNWSLFILDRTGHGDGDDKPLASGWSLTITTQPAP